MQAANVHSDTFKALNSARKHPTTQSAELTGSARDAAAQHTRGAAGSSLFQRQLASMLPTLNQEPLTKEPLDALHSDDFLGGNPFLQPKAHVLKSLGTNDFKGVAGKIAPVDDFKPLAEDDFLPGSKEVPQTQHEKLVEQTQKWVAQTFYGAMLKQMRNSPFKSEIFDGGRGGEAFSTLFDQNLADHMAKGSNNQLVNRIVKQIERHQAARQRQNPSSPSSPHAGVSPALSPNDSAAQRNTGFQPELNPSTRQ
jgi:Rod binding domain-containing protein